MKLLFVIASFLFASSSFAVTGNVNTYSYAGGSVLTSAYTVVWASTPTSASKLEICDTSTKIIKVATGATGSEKDIAVAPVSGCILVSLYIPQGTQISIKAIDATASTGYNNLSIF